MDDKVREYSEKFSNYWLDERIPMIYNSELSPVQAQKIRKEFLRMERERFRLFSEIPINRTDEKEIYNNNRAIEGNLKDALNHAIGNYRTNEAHRINIKRQWLIAVVVVIVLVLMFVAIIAI